MLCKIEHLQTPKGILHTDKMANTSVLYDCYCLIHKSLDMIFVLLVNMLATIENKSTNVIIFNYLIQICDDGGGHHFNYMIYLLYRTFSVRL